MKKTIAIVLVAAFAGVGAVHAQDDPVGDWRADRGMRPLGSPGTSEMLPYRDTIPGYDRHRWERDWERRHDQRHARNHYRDRDGDGVPDRRDRRPSDPRRW